jgi:hypothetical protein
MKGGGIGEYLRLDLEVDKKVFLTYLGKTNILVIVNYSIFRPNQP